MNLLEIDTGRRALFEYLSIVKRLKNNNKIEQTN